VSCEGGIYALKDGRDTPDTMQAIYRFPNFLMNWETRFTNGRGLDGGRTQTGPMRELIDRGEALERDGSALVVSVCAGFTAADIHDIGPSVTVTTDDNDAAGPRYCP